MNELVSIIMPSYNTARYISDSINSVLSQTYNNWELIMCDDASTDNTYEIAESYRNRFPDKIILIKNKNNSKLSFTLNHCLEYASGEYVARMDADDKSLPQRFEKQVNYLQTHSEVDLVGSAMQRFNEKGLVAVDKKPEHPDKYSLRKMIPFNHATIMTYKRVYDNLGGYVVSERTIRGQDYDLWFRFYHHDYKGDNLSDVLYLVREDEAAFKRRTFKVRLNGFKTACIGYKLLGFPKRWLIRPGFKMVAKSLVPTKLMMIIHKK